MFDLFTQRLISFIFIACIVLGIVVWLWEAIPGFIKFVGIILAIIAFIKLLMRG